MGPARTREACAAAWTPPGAMNRVNLSRPDRRERLDRLAAEFALGTSTRSRAPAPVGDRAARSRRRGCADRVGTAAGGAGRRACRRSPRRRACGRGSPRGSDSTSVRLRTRAHAAVVGPAGRLARAGGDRVSSSPLALGVAEFARPPAPAAAPIVIVLAGSDAKPALIAQRLAR